MCDEDAAKKRRSLKWRSHCGLNNSSVSKNIRPVPEGLFGRQCFWNGRSRSEFGSRLPFWRTKFCTDSRRNTSFHSIASLTSLAVDLFALPTLTEPSGGAVCKAVICRQPGFQVVGPRIWNDRPIDATSAESSELFNTQ